MGHRDRHHTSCRAALLGATLAMSMGLAVGAQPIFVDGFELASACSWSSTVGSQSAVRAYSTDFAQPDAPNWPSPWTVSGGVDTAEVAAGRLRFRPTPSGYSLARLVADRGFRDTEVEFTVRFDDLSTQGVGFYVRQNGGYLHQTAPPGEGYAVFVEGFRATPGIGVWKEENGSEILLDSLFEDGLLTQGVDYRVRFRAHQLNAGETYLQAKVWPAASPEPIAWQVEHVDATPVLQGISGGIALDSWSSIQSPNPITEFTWVDDVVVREICSPVSGVGAATPIIETLSLGEGPVWRDDHLLFTDIPADTIHRLDPPAALSIFDVGNGEANGLHMDQDLGLTLLAAEHAGRRIARHIGDGVVITVVDNYLGDAFNSPNDLEVHSDGTLYFTDPPYGLANPALREIPFNGVFRLQTDGTLTAEWEGVDGVNTPNGVLLSRDESWLFVTDTMQGTLLRFAVNGDGSLGTPEEVTSGLSTPDGMCRDQAGNLYVTTWGSGIEVFTADGAYLGNVPVNGNATNCTFGGNDLRTLYVTTTQGLYAYPSAVMGAVEPEG